MINDILPFIDGLFIFISCSTKKIVLNKIFCTQRNSPVIQSFENDMSPHLIFSFNNSYIKLTLDIFFKLSNSVNRVQPITKIPRITNIF